MFDFISVYNPQSILHVDEQNVIQKLSVHWTVFSHGYDSKNSILLFIIVIFLVDNIIHSDVWSLKEEKNLTRLAHNFRIEIANLSKYFHRMYNFGFRCVLNLNIHTYSAYSRYMFNVHTEHRTADEQEHIARVMRPEKCLWNLESYNNSMKWLLNHHYVMIINNNNSYGILEQR